MSGPLPFAIDVQTLARLREAGEPLTIVDIREPWETEICLINGSRTIPMRALPERLAELPRDGLLVVVCHHGARSAQATAWLRSRGVDQAVNLQGGVEAWAVSIEPEMARY
jgi:rhodanese-related sulfurtransferase